MSNKFFADSLFVSYIKGIPSNTFPIEELRSLLEKARDTDADLKQFGAEHHKYQWNPPASLKEIEKFEKETGISLPDGYRNFLLQAGNGGAGPFYGLFSLEQVAFLLDKAEGREKRELLYDLGRFPDAKEHLEIWLDFLREREDLELLHYALMSVPRVNESRLREALLEVQEAFPFALEQIHVDDYKDKEAMERSFRRDAERKVYKGAGTVLKDLFYESINPENTRFPRPYRLEMPGNALADLGMYRTPPADGILLHPLIALAIRQESGGRLPSTAWDWGRKLKQMKKLQLVLSERTVQSWDDERRYAYLRAPEEHFPPEPYYYDLRGWSVIGRMENLRELRICEICVEDFSFLTECKNLRTLSLYNTNFTDCRLLLKLPKLKYIDLRSCRLIHKEVLKKLHVECEL